MCQGIQKHPLQVAYGNLLSFQLSDRVSGVQQEWQQEPEEQKIWFSFVQVFHVNVFLQSEIR